jgi:hypothetical protein
MPIAGDAHVAGDPGRPEDDRDSSGRVGALARRLTLRYRLREAGVKVADHLLQLCQRAK